MTNRNFVPIPPLTLTPEWYKTTSSTEIPRIPSKDGMCLLNKALDKECGSLLVDEAFIDESN